MVIGSLVGTVFGLVFGLVLVEVNSGGLPGDWPLVVRVAGAVLALVLLTGIVRTARQARGR